MLKATLSGDIEETESEESSRAAGIGKKWTGGLLKLAGNTEAVGRGFLGACKVLLPRNELVMDVDRDVIDDSALEDAPLCIVGVVEDATVIDGCSKLRAREIPFTMFFRESRRNIPPSDCPLRAVVLNLVARRSNTLSTLVRGFGFTGFMRRGVSALSVSVSSLKDDGTDATSRTSRPASKLGRPISRLGRVEFE